jgi:hypothetical protein
MFALALHSLDDRIAYERDRTGERSIQRPSNAAAWIGFAASVIAPLVTIVVAKPD